MTSSNSKKAQESIELTLWKRLRSEEYVSPIEVWFAQMLHERYLVEQGRLPSGAVPELERFGVFIGKPKRDCQQLEKRRRRYREKRDVEWMTQMKKLAKGAAKSSAPERSRLQQKAGRSR